MKNLFRTIIVLGIILIAIPVAQASYCSPRSDYKSSYQEIYCDISTNWAGLKNADSEIFETIAVQFGIDSLDNSGELVRIIINEEYETDENEEGETKCNRPAINKYLNDNNIKLDVLPEEIKEACADQPNSSAISKWNSVTKSFKIAYNNERVMSHTQKKMEYEFKASERFWDGKLSESAPFDLIVDLNLIEVILFGNQAEWLDDVWSWPAEEDDGDGDDEDIVVPESGTNIGEDDGIADEDDDFDDSVGVTETEGTEPECVPADDPDADLGDDPGGGIGPMCGNGEIDYLYGEICDDGNNVSGDGCSQYCITEQTGANDICIDPEAVTFDEGENNQSDNQSDGQTGDESENEPNCPPGTYPKKDTSITGPAPQEADEYPQPDNYPGPNVGGTFKSYPSTEKPQCPEGYSWLETEGQSVSALGKSADYCIPSELCADVNMVRDFLAGGPEWRDYEENDPRRMAIESIESFFCVTLTTANRPVSTYAPDDGCIDCHIIAMVDTMDKALETNVTPMENTTGGFAMSSRWGPKFSFNLVTAIKAKLQLAPPKNTTQLEETNKEIERSESANAPVKNSGTLQENISDTLSQQIQTEKEAEEKRLNDLEAYRVTNSSITDQAFVGRVVPLLQQMNASFGRLGEKWMGINNIKIDTKDQCTF